jgi:NAD(P)-dependent dehydrogenase (short-subunit alcohol dehydrogenase family)
MKRLDNKVAIITGSGSGIGKAAALLFSREGAKVVLADINSDKGTEVERQIKKHGGEAIFEQVDEGISVDIERMVKQTIAHYGRLDILFNNAGYASEPLNEITEDKWRRAIDVMLTGPFLACKHAIPLMRKQGGGVVLNTASIGGLTASGGRAPVYNLANLSPGSTAAKGGLVMLTRFLARVLAKDNIRVNCICPGSVETGISASRWDPGKTDEERLAAQAVRVSHIPMGRVASPEEIASVVLFLASDEASYITGVALPIDGGVLA